MAKLDENRPFLPVNIAVMTVSDTRTLDDEWTVVTLDGRWSAQFEHTVRVTRKGVEVLTLP